MNGATLLDRYPMAGRSVRLGYRIERFGGGCRSGGY